MARTTPPAMEVDAAMGPSSTNVGPGPRPGPAGSEPPKLTAFVKALEATAGRPFAPLPLLKNHLTGVQEGNWVHDLASRVTAKVLRVGSNPLQAALVLFTPDGRDFCDGGDEPVAITALEHAGQPGPSVLSLRKLKTQIRAWYTPKVVIPPHFAKTQAFFVEYKLDTDLERCPYNPQNEHDPADTTRALFKLGKRRLVQYSYYTLDGNSGEPGSRRRTTTRLGWIVSKKHAGRVYLSVEVRKVHRVFSTAGEQKYEEYTCSRSVSVLAMERGKTWKPYRGNKLAQLRKTEPAVGKLPRKMRGSSRKACTF